MPTTKIASKFQFHPFFLALAPILYFYSHNQKELSLGIIFTPALIILVIVFLFLFLLKLFLGLSKAALFTSFVVTVFFTYGFISSLLKQIYIPFSGIVVGPHKILLPFLVLVLIVLLIKLHKSRSGFADLHRFLHIASSFLLAFQLFTVINYELTLPGTVGSRLVEPGKSQAPVADAKSPDIYYLILDGYAGNLILKDVYHYDNSAFQNFLRQSGFTVVDNAVSNYSQTHFSLPSSLNMTYLDAWIEKSRPTGDMLPFYALISQNEVFSFVKNKGYRVINFSSGWGPTEFPAGADVNYNKSTFFRILGHELSLNEFYLVFLQTTALSPFIKDSLADTARGRVIYTFDQLPEMPYVRGKKFVFAHIVIPHPPYLFDKDGHPVSDSDLELAGDSFSDRDHYLQQLQFATSRIQKVISEILARSQTPPVIVLQSDHGPSSILGHPYRWQRPFSEAGISERMHILNAYFLPSGGESSIYKGITPVNTFRVIFNYYFKSGFPLLPDKSYISDYKNVFEFFEVTEKLLR
jgi:hypothetical protein